jgi:tungstate transport system ATP-binding protein
MTELILNNVSFEADKTRLLHNINFSHSNPGISAILGPNGAGKSLLLSLIHGVIKPNTGAITWGGRAADKTKMDRGFVFQKPIVLRRSVRDNIAYPLKTLRNDGNLRGHDIDQMLELSQLTTLAHQPAANLSGGEAQRMAIARALITHPITLLLDEPCSNLDPASTKLIESMIHNFVAEGGNVLISTHDLAQARRLADEVWFMESGRLLEHGRADQFFDAPSTKQAKDYLGGHL